MKSSSRRMVALLWSRRRLQPDQISSSPAGAVPFYKKKVSSGVRFVGTIHRADVKKPTVVAAAAAAKNAARTIPYSTALLEEEESDDDDNTDDPNLVLPPLYKPNSKNNNIINSTHLPPLRKNNGLVRPYDDEVEYATRTTTTTTNRDNNLKKCTCGGYIDNREEDGDDEALPPPLPPPVYSVHKRVLPAGLTALSSPEGRVLLTESLSDQMAESYWSLTEQFVNQSDPAYCGVTTLLMVLNSMNVDPNSRWKGGWRYYGDEDVLLQRCCLNPERIKRVGITMEEFTTLGQCHGIRITMKRPSSSSSSTTPEEAEAEAAGTGAGAPNQYYSLEDFRADIRQTLDSRINTQNAMLVTSFSRETLQQTGDGHFSPIAAYHERSDQVLILDVARFKYPPYWVGVQELFEAMEPIDPTTQKPRGWYVMMPPKSQQYTNSYQMTSEDRRPAHLVPEFHEQEACPVGEIKVQFCPAKITATTTALKEKK